MTRLTTINHDRDASGMTYVYPVVSRRAGGVSVGINLSPNNACNFRCIYCQVPELTRGTSPALNLKQLESELSTLLEDIQDGSFLEERAPEGNRVLKDIAFSGNGEPTSSPDFVAAVDVVGQVLERRGLLGQLPIVLITNGTLLGKPSIVGGIDALAAINGRVWFKIDGVTRQDFSRVNDTPLDPEAHLIRLRQTAARIPTWIQTCIFGLDGEAPAKEARSAYLQALSQLKQEGVPIRGVLLYSVARDSQQPEADRLTRLTAEQLQVWADGIEKVGFSVNVSV